MSRFGLVGSFALALACGGGSQGDEDSGSSSDTDSTTTTGTTATVTTAATMTGVSVTLTSATTTVGTTTSPPGEPCCVPQGGPGCAEDPAIADCVCETDRYCCETNWDDVCVSRVMELGCGVCDPGPGTFTTSPDTGEVTTAPPPDNVGPCCEPHPETGCEVQTVSECVCNYLPECCEDAWREVCVGAVDAYGCGVCPHSDTSTTGVPPDNSEACCTSHASTGCEYPAIADCVCLEYPGCCADGWDQTCVDAVDSLGCGVCPP